MTPTGKWRDTILRMYWDGQAAPSVECPVGDFFCCGWQEYHQVSTLAVCVNPGSAFNCYWTMPFRQQCRITLENRGEEEAVYYYQIDYTLGEVPQDAAYFHAQFRRVNPLPYKEVYTILDGVQGQGHYVGTYMAWGVHNNGWWGEGEIKFYLDGDQEAPTICGTGTEDYFCGSYNFEDPRTHSRYVEFSTPYGGFYPVTQDGLYQSQKRFGAYRFHIADPHPLCGKPAGDHPGLGLAGRRPVPAPAGRYRLGCLLVPDAAHRALPALPDREFLEII